MSTISEAVIDHLGGTSALAKKLEAPVSTVHSWRAKGIPPARMAHIRLVAKAEQTPLPENLADLVVQQPPSDDAEAA